MVNRDTEEPPESEDPRLGLVRDLFAGRYEIEDRLTWGGLAIVYAAREPGREVAVSVLPLDCGGAPEVEQAFEIWAAGLEDFHHPGHVPVTDSGVQHGVPYLELERVPGETLWQRRPDDPRQALQVVVDVAEVVEAAHALDLVHWDLTPANVLVSGPKHKVRVLGFGVAPLLFSARDDKSTGPTGKGSGPKARRFMAPERLANAEGGLRADQYSLGALAYYALRGEAPPQDGKRPRLDELAGLEEVVARAMKVDPAERFPDVGTLRQALAAVLMKAEKSAREPSGVVENLADALEPSAPDAPRSEAVESATHARKSPLAWVAAVALFGALAGGYAFTRGGSRAASTAADDAHSRAVGAAEVTPSSVAPTRDTPEHQRRPAEPPEPGAPSAPTPEALDQPVAAPGEDDTAPGGAAEATPTPPTHGSAAASGEAPFEAGMPALLTSALQRADSGPPFTEPDLAPLYGYATAHPDEARAHAVMGHVFVTMHWNGAAADAYARAARVDDGLWTSDLVLVDLLRLARTRDDLFLKVWPPLRNRFGRAILPQVEAAIEAAPRAAEKARLRRLRARLERLPAS